MQKPIIVLTFEFTKEKEQMKQQLLKILLFSVFNIMLIGFHLEVFRSSEPFAAWVSVIVHIILLIIFPYTKFFKTNENTNTL